VVLSLTANWRVDEETECNAKINLLANLKLKLRKYIG